MSSSSDAPVVRGPLAGDAQTLRVPELRQGAWTRLGPDSGLADGATENTLAVVAERTRKAAQSQGYVQGWTDGRREAQAVMAEEQTRLNHLARVEQERRDAEHAAAIEALTAAAGRVRAVVAAVCAQVEEAATDLACDLTETLVGETVAICQEPGITSVRRALALMPDVPYVRLRLHPDAAEGADHAALAERGVTVVPDPTLDRLDSVVETDEQVVDLRLSSAMERVREVLR
jgi:flagellar assembly protein FliH